MENSGVTHQYGAISLAQRGGAASGALKASSAGLSWKRSSGGKAVDVPLADIKSLAWSRGQKHSMLSVQRVDGSFLGFTGFRDGDATTLASALSRPVPEQAQATLGHNWGDAAADGAGLTFSVGGGPAFRLPLTDVVQAQAVREEVMLEFPADDAAAGEHVDALTEVSFYLPKAPAPAAAEAGEAGGDEVTEAPSAARALLQAVLPYTDAGAATGDAITSFDQVAVIVPRGRFDVEMYASSLKLLGQAQDFRVAYDTILRIFVLPKTNVPQTLVVISLDPPIRQEGLGVKGQTFYPHILCQFPSDEQATLELDITDEALAAKNEKNGGKLQRSYSGPATDVFARVLRGLSGSKLTRPGAFRDAEGSGFAVKCSYKADDGYLYPLERAFFYVQKPPLLLVFDDVDAVEFLRPAQGVTAAKTFDLSVRLRNSQDYLFRGIPRGEWTNLFEFIQAKQLRIENFKEAQQGPGATAVSYAALGGARPSRTVVAFPRLSSRSSPRSLLMGKQDEKPAKKVKAAEDAPAKKTKAQSKAEGGVKKARKKKDKNAPKRGMSAFMFFSQDQRESVKADNPGIAFGEVGKVLGQRWKELSEADKKPYEEKAAKDKERYEKEKSSYEGGAKQEDTPAAEAGGDDDDDDSE
ncbi:FACT complex subunit SSRP1 [Auxenochlorella protothecoides]|uniref:FACT complex subunit SSRP1 n=1 Tax=Auxenochlorella protothecoides TaxID=3075 RepID=A0A087SKA5_AUXPR|nr:FACT complex subunit SSRP1 [Auxenochlorella protothecoides]KFM26159.1 FACT complex subunit SSRP1 [Auxenochlorella protothecoides]